MHQIVFLNLIYHKSFHNRENIVLQNRQICYQQTIPWNVLPHFTKNKYTGVLAKEHQHRCNNMTFLLFFSAYSL